MEFDAGELISASNDGNDTDQDGLPVEAVPGTDINNTDTDFDRLDDYNETVIYDSDPQRTDT